MNGATGIWDGDREKRECHTEVGQEPSEPGEIVRLRGFRGQNPQSLDTGGMGVRGEGDRFQSRLGAGKGKCSVL